MRREFERPASDVLVKTRGTREAATVLVGKRSGASARTAPGNSGDRRAVLGEA